MASGCERRGGREKDTSAGRTFPTACESLSYASLRPEVPRFIRAVVGRGPAVGPGVTVVSSRGMTDVAIDDAVLDRLIEQFASPYDCLRELVQNGMDAGTSRIDVELHVHGDGDEVAFEIVVIDDGCGMTEAVIDAELARLFASSKRADRTMAGGFGVGFVSVFAWRPDVVLLQTGRHGESWELEFERSGRFAKQRLAEPIEGTTVRLIRRGRRSEHATILEAARASLWRWCRFCPIEIVLTDATTGESTRIEDVAVDSAAAATAEHRAADTHVHVAFAVPPRAVLLRHGLVLAEGSPLTLLPRVFIDCQESVRHVQIWASSPSLMTDIGRDHVVDDAGRRLIEQRTVDLLHRARKNLLDKTAEVADAPGEWTPEHAARYAHLHAHLALERTCIDRIDRAPVIRLADGSVCSQRQLVEHAAWAIVERVDPDDHAPAASIVGVPRVVGEDDARSDWLRDWLAPAGVHLVDAGALLREVTPVNAGDAGLIAGVADVLRSANLVEVLRVGAFAGPPSRPWAAQVADGLVLLPPARPPRRELVWIDPRHPIVVAASDGRLQLENAVAMLALAITKWLGVEHGDCVRAIDDWATDLHGARPA